MPSYFLSVIAAAPFAATSDVLCATVVAVFVVASQMGIWGTAKSSQDPQLMAQASEALCDYLDGLRPAVGKTNQ